MKALLLVVGLVLSSLTASAFGGGHGHRGHHGGHGHHGGGHYYPRPGFPGGGYYPGYPSYPGYGYARGIVCAAVNEYGYSFQGTGYNQWTASQNAAAICYQYSRYCQVVQCSYF